MEPYTLSTLQTLLADVFPLIQKTGVAQDKAYLSARQGVLTTALKMVRHPEFQVVGNSTKLVGKVMEATHLSGLNDIERELLAQVRLGLLRKTQPWTRPGEGMGHHLLPLCLMVGDAGAVDYLLNAENAPTGAAMTARLIPKPPSNDGNSWFGLLPEEAQSLTTAAYCLLSMPTNDTARTHTDALVAMGRSGVDLAAPMTELGHHAWDFIACGQTMMALAQAGLEWGGVDEKGRSRLARAFERQLPTDRVVSMIQATLSLHEEGRLPKLKHVWPELVRMFGKRLSHVWSTSERDIGEMVEAMHQLSRVTGLPLGNRSGTNPTLLGCWAQQLLAADDETTPTTSPLRLENYPAFDKLSCVRDIPKRLGMTEEGIPDGVWVAMALVHRNDYGQGKSFSRAALNELLGAHSIEEGVAGFAKALDQLGPNKRTWKSLLRLRSALPNRFWEQQVREMTAKSVALFDGLAAGAPQKNWRSSSEFTDFVSVASEIFKPLAQGEQPACSHEDIILGARLNLWAGWTSKLVQGGFERWVNSQPSLDTVGLMRTMDAMTRQDIRIGNSPSSQALFRGLVLQNTLAEAAPSPRSAPRF